MFCIEANCPTICLQGHNAVRFFRSLDPSHVPPHRIAFMRLVRLLDQALFREYHRIVNDNALLYGTDFVSTNSDFYTNKERRESYGCLVANMLAQQYVFNDGRRLFMSTRTYNEGGKKLVVMAEMEKRDLETILAFDQFNESKTSMNIAAWLTTGHCRAGLKPDYILCHATDGASNAVGSSMEFQAITSCLKEERNIRHYVCMAHQVNRSAKYASGTGDFRENANEELSSVLKKMHEINGRVYRSETRLKVLFAVQKEKNRYEQRVLPITNVPYILLTHLAVQESYSTSI